MGRRRGGPFLRTCLTAFAESGAFDVVALVHDFPFRSQAGEVDLATQLAAELAAATASVPAVLPVYISLTSGDSTPEIEAVLDEHGGIPALRGTVEASTAIARLAWWEARRARRLVDGPVRWAWPRLAVGRTAYGHDRPGAQAAATAPRTLAERESLDLVRSAGIPVADTIPVVDADAAVGASERLGFPVVVKLDAAGLAHKSDIGGVVVGAADAETVRRAVSDVLDAGRRAEADVRGVLVQAMAQPGMELILGARRDAQFGPLVLAGLGGVLAEALDDVAIRLAPLTDADAAAMLSELRGAAILDGVRGRPAIDHPAVARAIVAARRGHGRSSGLARGRSQPRRAQAGGRDRRRCPGRHRGGGSRRWLNRTRR